MPSAVWPQYAARRIRQGNLIYLHWGMKGQMNETQWTDERIWEELSACSQSNKNDWNAAIELATKIRDELTTRLAAVEKERDRLQALLDVANMDIQELSRTSPLAKQNEQLEELLGKLTIVNKTSELRAQVEALTAELTQRKGADDGQPTAIARGQRMGDPVVPWWTQSANAGQARARQFVL